MGSLGKLMNKVNCEWASVNDRGETNRVGLICVSVAGGMNAVLRWGVSA